jgi:O-antigen ligase
VAAAVIIGVPLVVAPIGWQRYVALRWLVLAAAVLAGVSWAGPRIWARLPAHIAFGWVAVLATVFVSSVTAPVASAAVLGDSARRGGALTVVVLAGAYLVGLAAQGARPLVLRAAPVAILALVAAMAIGYRGQSLVVSSDALVGNAGLLGGYLVVLMGCAAAVARADPEPWARKVGVVAAVLAVPAVILTGSHAATFAAAVLVVGLAGAVGWRRGGPMARRGGVLVASALVIVAVSWSAQFRVFTDSLRARLDTWAVAVEVVLARPVLGWGPEGFRHGFAAVVPEPFVARYSDELVQDRAHSIVLDHAASTGLIGLAAFAVLVVAVVHHLDLGDPAGRMLGATLAGAGVFLLAWFPSFDLAAVVAVLAGLATPPRPCLL